jgi:hypothetical protein
LKETDVSIRYVVKNENTLGYIDERQPSIMGVLAGLVARGGHDPKNGIVSVVGATIRNAKTSDFDTFRVMAPPNFVPVAD